MVYIPKLEDLSYLECTVCKNYFFIHEITTGKLAGMNDPNYCPYCGCEFSETTLLNPEDEEDEGDDYDDSEEEDIDEYED